MSFEGSNRTFMELKSKKKLAAIRQSEVLIVPLWNWNNFGEYMRVAWPEF